MQYRWINQAITSDWINDDSIANRKLWIDALSHNFNKSVLHKNHIRPAWNLTLLSNLSFDFWCEGTYYLVLCLCMLYVECRPFVTQRFFSLENFKIRSGNRKPSCHPNLELTLYKVFQYPYKEAYTEKKWAVIINE